jgi:hypothetical protein
MTYNAHDVALLDQIEAAERDLTRILDKAATTLGETYLDPHPGSWLLDQIDHFTHDLLTGHTTECGHLTGTGPRPAFAALSTPGHLVCPQCIRTLITDDADTAPCDRCHQPSPHMQILTIELGTVALFILECPACTHHDTHQR